MKSTFASPLGLALAALGLTGVADAFWRMPCRGRTGLARLDPIMDYGEVSGHSHTVQGSGAFSMDADYDILRSGNCTSCQVTQDLSAYWTPSLHFMYPNGSSVLVDQDGGMLAYYLLYGDNVTAFPDGFRMISGDAMQRNFTWPVPDPEKPWYGEQKSQKALAQKGIGFNCLHYDRNPPESTLYRHFLPDKTFLDENCDDGLRLEVMFPSCWNGKDLDSDDHKSHVAFPDQTITGDCPEGYDTRLVSLFYETIWNTNDFIGIDGEFVLANGDPTGYGYHGDFMSGWNETFLQEAVDTCTNESGEIEDCALFDIQSEADTQQCFFETPQVLAHDNCAGPRNGLCGDNPIQSGPAYATVASASGSATTSAASVVVSPSTPLVPVLSFSTGRETFVSDKYGGGITVERVHEQSTVAATTTPTTLVTSTPATTPAPSTADAGSIITTTTYTSDNALVELAIEEVDVYVTATDVVYTTETAVATAAAKHRRHLDSHLHGHHQHGLLH